VDTKQTNLAGDILTLCREHPGASVHIENLEPHGALTPLSAVLTTGRKVSPFLFESVYLFIGGSVGTAAMRAGVLASRLEANPTLPVSVHLSTNVLAFGELPPVELYAVRLDGEAILIDAAPQTPLRTFQRLLAENPKAPVLCEISEPEPGEPPIRAITAVDHTAIEGVGDPFRDGEPNFAIDLRADPEGKPLLAAEILRLVNAEIGDRSVVECTLDMAYPIDDEEYQFDSAPVGEVVLRDGAIILIPHIERVDHSEFTPPSPPLRAGDIVVGGPGWAWGQRVGVYVFVTDDPSQHRAFTFDLLRVQGWADTQETIVRRGVSGLYGPEPDPHSAYDPSRAEAKFSVDRVMLYRGGRITHLEGVPHIPEPGDAILVEATRMNDAGNYDLGAEKIRFIEAERFDGKQYVMRAQPRTVGSVFRSPGEDEGSPD
jgi:hypothetical protein